MDSNHRPLFSEMNKISVISKYRYIDSYLQNKQIFLSLKRHNYTKGQKNTLENKLNKIY